MTAYELISNLSDKYKWKEDVLSLIQTHPEINSRQQFNFAYEVLSLEPIKLLNNYDWRGIINNLKHKENPKVIKVPDVVESKGKTPKEWFEALPDSCEWKQKALDNHFKWTDGGKKGGKPSLYSTLYEAVKVAFYWTTTPEGHAYWRKIQSEVLEDEQKQLEAVQGYDTISNFVWTPEKDVDTYESLVENNFSKLSSEAIQKAFDKHGVKQAVKDSAGKISFKEIDPEFICLMARRMNSNKIQFGGKYEEFNYQKDINVLDLIDATERHLVDLKLLLQGRSPILNPSESELQHIASVSCNMMMIFYSINAKTQTIGQE